MATEIRMVDGQKILASEDYGKLSDQFASLKGDGGTIRVTTFGSNRAYTLNVAHIVSMQERETRE